MAIPRINGRSLPSISDFSKSHRSWLFALVLVLASFFITSSSQAQEGRRLRAGYTSLSGNMLPLWAARDGGYFKKYGLDFDLISMPSGNEGMRKHDRLGGCRRRRCRCSRHDRRTSGGLPGGRTFDTET
jgi:hypothetical protein